MGQRAGAGLSLSLACLLAKGCGCMQARTLARGPTPHGAQRFVLKAPSGVEGLTHSRECTFSPKLSLSLSVQCSSRHEAGFVVVARLKRVSTLTLPSFPTHTLLLITAPAESELLPERCSTHRTQILQVALSSACRYRELLPRLGSSPFVREDFHRLTLSSICA